MSCTVDAEDELSSPEATGYIRDLLTTLVEHDSSSSMWKLFASIHVDGKIVEHLTSEFFALADSGNVSDTSEFSRVILPIFGFTLDEYDAPNTFIFLAEHVRLTLQAVYEDTEEVPELEQLQRRIWAVFYEAMIVAKWRAFEGLAKQTGRTIGYEPRL